ncbi:MAG TPA: hypothetical protein VMO17_23940 [Terriglobia bacterium]|nr:hypothetical protein [Terriglobia bacterium]
MTRLLRKPLAIFVIAFIVYIVLSMAEKGEATFSTVKETLLHESAHVALYVAIGAFMIALIAEALGEHLVPVVEHSLHEFSTLMAGKVSEGIRAGFGSLGTALSSSLGQQFAQTWEQVKKTADDPNEPPEEKEIARLLLSDAKEDLEHAASILARPVGVKNYIRTIKNYTTLAYKFWSIQVLGRAIEIAETGLKLATAKDIPPAVAANKQDLADVESALKSSLAYYYADTGKAEYEEAARQYAKESFASPSYEPEKLDTQGFVLIVYGKNKEEILSGLKMCRDAWDRGLPIESYHRHFERAYERLKAIT